MFAETTTIFGVSMDRVLWLIRDYEARNLSLAAKLDPAAPHMSLFDHFARRMAMALET